MGQPYLFNCHWKSVESWGGTKSVGSWGGTKRVGSWRGMKSVESWEGTRVESWVGTNNLIFCSGYNTPTLFWNLQKRSLICREYGFPQTCKPQWSTVRLSFFSLTTTSSRWYPLSATWGTLSHCGFE